MVFSREFALAFPHLFREQVLFISGSDQQTTCAFSMAALTSFASGIGLSPNKRSKPT